MCHRACVTRSLDDLDRRILAQLSRDARATFAAVAQAVGLSRAAVHQRVARLERQGVIRGYTTLLHPAAQEVALTAIVMVNIDAPAYAAVATELQGWPEVRACWSVAGERDMALLVDVGAHDDLMEITRRLSTIAAVRDTATHVVLRTHFDRAAPVGDSR